MPPVSKNTKCIKTFCTSTTEHTVVFHSVVVFSHEPTAVLMNCENVITLYTTPPLTLLLSKWMSWSVLEVTQSVHVYVSAFQTSSLNRVPATPHSRSTLSLHQTTSFSSLVNKVGWLRPQMIFTLQQPLLMMMMMLLTTTCCICDWTVQFATRMEPYIIPRVSFCQTDLWTWLHRRLRKHIFISTLCWSILWVNKKIKWIEKKLQKASYCSFKIQHVANWYFKVYDSLLLFYTFFAHFVKQIYLWYQFECVILLDYH